MLWFRPTTVKGLLVDAKFTLSRGELILMTSFPMIGRKPRSLRFFRLDTATCELLPTYVDFPLPPSAGNGKPVFGLSPGLDTPGTDFIYLLAGTCLQVISLATGQPVGMKIDPVTRDLPPEAFLSELFVTSDHEHCVLLARGGASIYIFEVQDANNEVRSRRRIAEGHKPRRHSAPLEQRLRPAEPPQLHRLSTRRTPPSSQS